MSINPDIKKAIEIIDQRIESLKNIRDNLAMEFGMNEVVKSTSAPSPQASKQLSFASGASGLGGIKTSKDKIAAFLHGRNPASRKEIVIGTGLPDGTVSYALNDRERFRRTDNGWVNVSLGDFSAELTTTTPAPEGSDNKTEAVRSFFRERGTRGATPADLGDYLRTTGVTQNRSYAYSAIARLKKQDEIKRRSGRYYGTEKLIPLPTNEAVQ